MKWSWSVVLAAVICGLTYGGVALAAEVPPNNTVTLAPARVDADFEPGMSAKTIMFTLENTYTTTVTLDTRLTDIDDSAGQLLPTSGASAEVTNIAELSDSSVVIEPGAKKFVTLTLKNPESLTPGGHYFSVVFTQGGADGTNVTLRQGLSALIFLTKLDGQVRSVKLGAFSVATPRFSLPRSAKIDIVNNGNAFATPRASVRVMRPDGTVLANGIYNSVSRKLLPGQTLSEGIKIMKIKDSWLPTRLSVELAYRADGIDNIKLSTKSYLYIPARSLILIIVLLAAVGYLVVWRVVWLRKRATSFVKSLLSAKKPDVKPEVKDSESKSTFVKPENKSKSESMHKDLKEFAIVQEVTISDSEVDPASVDFLTSNAMQLVEVSAPAVMETTKKPKKSTNRPKAVNPKAKATKTKSKKKSASATTRPKKAKK